jgi:glycolate oxidase FAD binding subunit
MSSSPLPATAAALDPALRDILGDALAPGDAAFAVDELVPRFVATPASVEELAAVLAVANERGATVIPWGGGQHMELGNVPARYDVALRTARLDRVLEYEPADMTVTVEAGITMGRLQALLAEHGQFLPIDAAGEATIGGVLAAGVSGPSRHAYGLPRDWLLGCRVAHADGAVSKGGGRVVKNVAGYDLPKLSVGSLGTLGIVVEATFKVAPLPAAQETFLAAYPSLAAAADTVFAADERGLALRALALRAQPRAEPGPKPQYEALASFWLAGPRAAVDRTARELADLARGAETRRLESSESERWWAQLNEAGTSPEGGVALRASLPPSGVVSFMERLAALGREAAVRVASLSYPTTGLVLAQLDGDAAVEQLVSVIEEARRQARDADGSLVVMAAPVAVKKRIDVWGSAGGVLPLVRRLKEQFDARDTLNPGRFAGSAKDG